LKLIMKTLFFRGNHHGQKPWKAGKACSACAKGQSCKDGLCVGHFDGW